MKITELTTLDKFNQFQFALPRWARLTELSNYVNENGIITMTLTRIEDSCYTFWTLDNAVELALIPQDNVEVSGA